MSSTPPPLSVSLSLPLPIAVLSFVCCAYSIFLTGAKTLFTFLLALFILLELWALHTHTQFTFQHTHTHMHTDTQHTHWLSQVTMPTVNNIIAGCMCVDIFMSYLTGITTATHSYKHIACCLWDQSVWQRQSYRWALHLFSMKTSDAATHQLYSVVCVTEEMCAVAKTDWNMKDS